MVRFRRSASKKIEYVHTLNASGLATSRLFVGLVEQLQRADGSIVIPDVLRKWVGKDVLNNYKRYQQDVLLTVRRKESTRCEVMLPRAIY